MKRRWSVILLCTHVVIAAVLVAKDELRFSKEFARWQQVELTYRTAYNPVPTPEMRAMIDYWASNTEKTVDVLNMPAMLIVGWYSHPFNRASSLLSAVELRLTTDLTVKARVIVLDLLLLLFIGLQWLLIGYAIQKRLPLVGFVRAVFVSISVVGVLMACLCLPPWWQGNQYVEGLVGIFALSVVCAWVVGLAAATAAVLWYCIRAITPRLRLT
jgi:hypothetical protein